MLIYWLVILLLLYGHFQSRKSIEKKNYKVDRLEARLDALSIEFMVIKTEKVFLQKED